MGVVLAVREEATGEPLAIKLLGAATDLADGPESTDDTIERASRLKREAQAAMRIASEHVVRVRDVSSGGNDVGPYIVMERLEGTDLAEEWPVGTKMPASEVADVALQVCEALSHAHLAGIIHRDIKPSNLFLAMTGDGEEIIKVLDFGISKVTTRAEWERTQGTLTVGDAVLGSPQFVSPEQLRDSRTVDPRTDIWSLGVVMYRLATGAYPFTGETIGQLFTRILERDPAPLSTHGVAADSSQHLQMTIDGCLKRNLDERYSNVAELARDLAPIASDRWRPLAEAIGARLARQMRARSLSSPGGGSSSASSVSPPPASSPASKSLAPPPPVAWRPVVVVATVLVALFSVGLIWSNRSVTPPTLPTTTTPSAAASASMPAPSDSSQSSASAAAPAAAAAAAVASGVEVKVSAEQPIEKVRAPGLRRALLEEGRATLILAEWAGEIEVEAELAGGAKARRAITMAGPRDVRLMTMPAAKDGPKDGPNPARPPPTTGTVARGSAHVPPPPTATAPPSTASSSSSSPSRTPTSPSTALSSELHDNPYKKQ
jgi:eukaryotic-like serine/threonine-protein kinase